MHNNYHFLRHLSRALHTTLAGAVISECFTQNREELIIRFETHGGSYYIKASLLSTFSCLTFASEFHRARKNSLDLFGQLIGQRVMDIRQFSYERSFAIILTNNLAVVFKMHGNRANVIVFENEVISDLFKKNLKADNEIQLSHLDREIDWSYSTFEKYLDNLPRVYFTFGKVVWRYLEQKGFATKPVAEKWEMIQTIRQLLDNNNFYLCELDGQPVLSLLPLGAEQQKFDDPIEAVNEFYYRFTQAYAFQKERATILSALTGKLQSGKSYYEKNQAKLNEIGADTSYKIWADLVMANLHAIKPNTEKVTLDNFYNNNHPIDIPLKKDLSPQKNAERFYRKSKNQQIELQRLGEGLTQKQQEIEWTQQQLTALQQITDLKTLRAFVAGLRLQTSEQKDGVVQPFHEFSVGGYRIWVGKNAQSNDTLTFKYGYKEDLWLHAKDVAGSHVLIKHQAGKNFPKPVIEAAAQLAAYNSKRKTETLCPVIVTPRKYVRKRKGDPAGMVVVEREEVILVEPKLPL